MTGFRLEWYGPNACPNLPPDWEAFESLLQAHGYFKDGTPKTQAARDIAMLIVPERNASTTPS